MGLMKHICLYGMKQIARGALNVAGGGVLGDVVMDGVEEIWYGYHRETEEDKRIEDIQTLVQASNIEVKEQIRLAVQEIAAQQTDEIRQQLEIYLLQVPAMIRRSLRRPSDPSGSSLQKNLIPRKAQDLIPYLPTRIARYQPGDFPLAGVDWKLEELLGFGGFG